MLKVTGLALGITTTKSQLEDFMGASGIWKIWRFNNQIIQTDWITISIRNSIKWNWMNNKKQNFGLLSFYLINKLIEIITLGYILLNLTSFSLFQKKYQIFL